MGENTLFMKGEIEEYPIKTKKITRRRKTKKKTRRRKTKKITRRRKTKKITRRRKTKKITRRRKTRKITRRRKTKKKTRRRNTKKITRRRKTKKITRRRNTKKKTRRRNTKKITRRKKNSKRRKRKYIIKGGADKQWEIERRRRSLFTRGRRTTPRPSSSAPLSVTRPTPTTAGGAAKQWEEFEEALQNQKAAIAEMRAKVQGKDDKLAAAEEEEEAEAEASVQAAEEEAEEEEEAEAEASVQAAERTAKGGQPPAQRYLTPSNVRVLRELSESADQALQSELDGLRQELAKAVTQSTAYEDSTAGASRSPALAPLPGADESVEVAGDGSESDASWDAASFHTGYNGLADGIANLGDFE